MATSTTTPSTFSCGRWPTLISGRAATTPPSLFAVKAVLGVEPIHDFERHVCINDCPGHGFVHIPGGKIGWREHAADTCAQVKPDGNICGERRFKEYRTAKGVHLRPRKVSMNFYVVGTSSTVLLVGILDGAGSSVICGESCSGSIVDGSSLGNGPSLSGEGVAAAGPFPSGFGSKAGCFCHEWGHCNRPFLSWGGCCRALSGPGRASLFWGSCSRPLSQWM